MTRLILVALCVVLVTHAAGCRSRSNATVQASTTTVGQELQDLDAAHDQKLLSDEEYKKQREAILKRNTAK